MADVPVYNGLTDEWHPTQMLADFLTCASTCDKPLHEVAYCFMGDGRFNMGRSLLVGRDHGLDVRICAPRTCGPRRTSRPAPARGPRSPARDHLTADPDEGGPAATSCTPTCGCRWVSRRTSGRRGSSASRRTRSTPRRWPHREPARKFMHCLPAFHDARTRWAARSPTNRPGALEVTDEVFASPASTSPSTRPRTGCTPSRR